jgi:hypothetical protein
MTHHARGRGRARRALVAALAAVGTFTAPAAALAMAAGHGAAPLVVTGHDTVVVDEACPAGVCPVHLVDGRFGLPTGPGSYAGELRLDVGAIFPNGEGGVCAPLAGRITLGPGTADRLLVDVSGSSCQVGAGDPSTSAFTLAGRFRIAGGTGAYAHAHGAGLVAAHEDADDHEQLLLVGRVGR